MHTRFCVWDHPAVCMQGPCCRLADGTRARPTPPPTLLPTPALPRSVMPQDHLNYAATWWTLSAATLALAVKAIRQGIKPR